MYAILFLVGFFGFVGMASLSFLHTGHSSHSGHGVVKAVPQGHGPRVHSGGGRGGGGKPVGGRGGAVLFWRVFSPFDLLAYATGAGAVGEILRQTALAPSLVLLAALVGALAFNFALAKPLLNRLLRFESRPSEGLEGSVAQRGEAVSRFDAQGRGLVRLALDGQLVQVLAHLDSEEHGRGVTVLKGDPLVVVEVDAARNTCRVTRELAS